MSSPPILAGRLRRLCACSIDAIVVPGLTLILVMVTGVVEDAADYATNAWILWVLLLAVVSYLIVNGFWLYRSGQTLGKKLLGIAIVSNPASGTSPSVAPFWRLICIRALFFPVLFVVFVPTFMILPLLDQLLIFTKKRRCLHDLAAGTMVIRNNPHQEKGE